VIRQALRIAGRELAAMVRSPIAYVVAVAFLVLQGLSFYAVVAVHGDPRRPAPLGAVLEGHFGGDLLHWTVLLAVIALLAMRTIAESRRAGTWEVLLTAPVGEGAAVVGAWLGALAFYALLWIPTLAYLAVLAAYAPAGAAFEPGPIAAAYLGELLVGASFLAVGVAASAATANQIVAGVATFAVLLALLIAGEAGELAPGGRLAAGSEAISVRGHLAAFARGEVALLPVVFHAGLAVTGLSAAAALARAGRRRPAEVGARAVATGLVAVIAILAGVIAARHPRALDVTSARRHSLDAPTRGLLARLDGPVEVAVLRPEVAALDPVYGEVERTAARLAAAQPLVTVRRIDPLREPDFAAELARLAGTEPTMVERGGGVMVRRGERRHAVLLVDLAEYGLDVHRQPTVVRLSAEAALAGALVQVGDDRPATVCLTAGHGELPLAARDDGLDVALAAARLRQAGVRVEAVEAIGGGVPARCDAVAVLGPGRPLPAAAADAIAAHVAAGGGLLVAASGRDVAGELPATGLEPLLAARGLAIAAALVVDLGAPLDLPLAFRVSTGYGAHPVVRGFAEWRPTVWQRARPVLARPVAGVTRTPLVSSSPRSFATRDLAGAAGAAAPTDPDLLGPLPLAVWSEGPGGAVAVVGSAESLASAAPRAGVGAGDVLLASLLAHLAGRALPELGIRDEAPAQVRLVMTRGERSAVFLLCVVVLPVAFAAAGLGAGLWRRRRRA
jgi:ABC-2 type transport system permease protein